ncbi:Lipoate-protein ligase A [Halanaeroarchaeum sp. HSR-CO]|uniref:lipoate--protein ligase family protein n=1 Tax=Halanaeroarchaeum sp. HSR-CO TaxID=2866382 RepID=UPI00217CE354|nr:biotin/lipoate A/B protein ligase family protein [Halanaeroarchaeum sp. HSR-CO]UWG47154.1 Lipoate-protein ligase A [Halanaeroarchaeum sp. HSR-CO]
MDLQDRDWRLIREERRSGPMQMALDEIAARTAGAGGPRTVRVYSWSPSTLSLGYRQEPATVDWGRCDREGISVTRRQTGGGGIYHDAYGDISYSIVAPAEELPGDLMESYEILMKPVFDAFDRMDVPATYVSSERPALYEPACYLRELHPAHDVVVDGRKIAGNAQYRQRDAVIQHGSLSYALDPDRHRGVFTDIPVDEATFRERITSIGETAGIDRPAAVEALESALEAWADANEGAWTDEEIEAATALAEQKYGSSVWNRDRIDPTN